MDRVQNTKTILWLIAGIAAAVGVTRFLFGLGVTTNLTDTTPWGFWIGFDVMAGVALAGGGFTLTALFYMFKREEFHPLVKPAVLTAFLGYLAVVFGLLFDLGLPWNIWHMMIYWNPHSPLFEVGWCVMLYSTVLLLEFSPVPLEEFSRYAKIRNFLMKFRFPLVLLGIMLSTLHQSSLGSLFLIMPARLHELWYSSILPIMFFVSAIALGLGMVSLESLVSHWLYRRKPETQLVSKLTKIAAYVLAVYFLVKIADIAISGELAMIFSGTFEANLFIAELLISTLIPIVLFSIPKTRSSSAGQWIGSTMVVLGMVFNRVNVGGLAMLSSTGDSYVPSWMEIAISVGVVSVAGLVFLFAVEKLHIWEKRPRHPESDPHALPKFDYTTRVWLGTPVVAARTKYSLAFILAFALGFALIPGRDLDSRGIHEVEVEGARGGSVLFIDGNRDSFGVQFKHDFHANGINPSIPCASCHHMNLPQDSESGCWQCHRSMYTETDVFNHDWHSSPSGGNLTCIQCHEQAENRRKSTAKECSACHTDLIPTNAAIVVDSNLALSYTDAMHEQCITCHKRKISEMPAKAHLADCTTCHKSSPESEIDAKVLKKLAERRFNRVAVPASSFGAE